MTAKGANVRRRRKPEVDPADDASRSQKAGEDLLDSIFIVKLLDLAVALDRSASVYYGSRFGLRVIDIKLMIVLAATPGVTIIEVSRRVRVDKAWISRSVLRLGKRGLLRKAPMPGNERAVTLVLTDKGHRLLDELHPIIHERQRRLLRGENRKELEAAVVRLTLRAQEMVAEDESEWERQSTQSRGG